MKKSSLSFVSSLKCNKGLRFKERLLLMIHLILNYSFTNKVNTFDVLLSYNLKIRNVLTFAPTIYHLVVSYDPYKSSEHRLCFKVWIK